MCNLNYYTPYLCKTAFVQVDNHFHDLHNSDDQPHRFA